MTSKRPRLSMRDKIMEVARGLNQPFMECDLIVSVWIAYKQEFGLRGYQSVHLDAGVIRAYLCGKRGLVGRGYLERVRDKVYRVVQKET